MPMEDRAVNLMAQLLNQNIGQRPLCFITHSMGGLLAKEILLHAAEGRTEYAVFATAARGVVFLGTPHTGSGLTKVVDALAGIYRATDAVQDLRANGAHLRHLNDRYRDWAVESGIRHAVFFETHPTKGFRVVDQASANPGLPNIRPVPVDADHIDICKPTDRDSLVYGQVKRFIKGILDTAVKPDPVPPVVKFGADTRLFVGRTNELAWLEKSAAESRSGTVLVVHGLGGVGKSTLAARFAELHFGQFSVVWWVTAESTTEVEHGLADLAAALLPDDGQSSLKQRTELAVGWLSSHDDWLLILDNLTTLAHVSGLLKRVRGGKIIITSRQGTGWRGFSTLRLDELPRNEALELLEQTIRADWPEADLTGGEKLCTDLGALPLALEQAGAYIAETRTTPTRYLELLKKFPARMFATTALAGDTQHTMARVWRITLDRLADTPMAATALRRLAWFASDHIPRTLLEGPEEDPEMPEALGRLAAYNMISLDIREISLHRLVQLVTRTPDPDDPHRRPQDIADALHDATRALACALDKHDYHLPSAWPDYRALVPHAHALLHHSPPDVDTDDSCLVLNLVGGFLTNQGAPESAVPYLKRDLASTRRLHGPDHRDTIASGNTLANAYRSSGDLKRALPLYEASLAAAERVLGTDDPDTLSNRNSLALAYRFAGDLRRAIPLFELNLSERQRILGDDHPATLASQDSLAYAYQIAGDVERAIPMFERGLTDSKRILGPDHPDTLTAVDNLARACQAAGQTKRAIPMFETNLANSERVLGPDHPDTFTSRDHLASAYRLVGDIEQAVLLHEAVLTARMRVLGPSHPETIISQNNLARSYQSAGDPIRAISLFEEALANSIRVHGPDYSTTRTVRGNLEAIRNA